MKNLTNNEKAVLDLMQKENFRGISKNNVLQLASILDKVDPDVAKELIAQIPEGVRAVIEAERVYSDVLAKGIESAENSTESCFKTEDDIIKSLQREIDKEGVTFEEKKYYFEKMEDAAKRKEGKDTEHKNLLRSIMDYGGKALLCGVMMIAGIFLYRIETTA